MNAIPRKGEWMQTYSGRQFWPQSPRPEDIELIDIAQALSQQCRYGGHCLKFYSVAEHSVLLYREAKARCYPLRLQRAALFHDASEGYLVDIPRPIKSCLANYNELEFGLMLAIARKFDFQWPLPPQIKDLDNAILRDERMQNMSAMDVPPDLWGDRLEALGITLKFWTAPEAFAEFLRAALETLNGGPTLELSRTCE